MSAIIYTLTKRSYNLILQKTAKKLTDGKRALFPDQAKVIRCYQCKELLFIGEKIVSKTFGCQYRIHYCISCARLLKII